MKKVLSVILVMALALVFVAACVPDAPPPVEPAATPEPTPPPSVEETDDDAEAANGDDLPDGTELVQVGDWTIGIMTGTVTQGEEEYLAAMNMENYFGSDRIIRTTYPDNFGEEIETVIANIAALADQGADAIVIVQAVGGTIAAIQQVRETHGDDFFFFVGVTHEPPAEIAAHADIALISDDLSMGRVIMEQAQRMGADTFGHISFPRHLGMENIAARRELLMEHAEMFGIECVELTAPDPMSEGMPTTQMFILENVPRWIEEHGENIAFFSTNCGLQEPLLAQISAYGGYYPLQCCPSPFHALPAAFNIDLDGREGDIEFLIEQLNIAVPAAGAGGRISTWPIPINMLFVETGVKYAIEYLEGRTNGKHDPSALDRVISEVAASFNGSVELAVWPLDGGGELDNMYRVLSDFITFG
jgi:hypothetical protein